MEYGFRLGQLGQWPQDQMPDRGDDFSHQYLDRVAVFQGYALAVRTDSGPELTSRKFLAWAHSCVVRHILIQPGKPMQNGYIESFNGKFRDECLNDQWF